MGDSSPEFRHDIPHDLRAILNVNAALETRWNGLTELARNEWICWVISAKKQETRARRLGRLQEEVSAGKRRPCCWPGCPHRRESARNWIKL